MQIGRPAQLYRCNAILHVTAGVPSAVGGRYQLISQNVAAGWEMDTMVIVSLAMRVGRSNA